MHAAATFTVQRDRVHWRDAPPVVLRPIGRDRLHLLHGAGGPLGGDRLGLTGSVGTECALDVGSAGATVVQPGTGQSASWTVRLDVAAGATVRWAPQPTVVCSGADFRTGLHATVHPSGRLCVREILVLGRVGECGGRCSATLAVTVGDRPLVVHENLLDGADPVLCGPAGSGGRRVQGSVLVAGRGVEPPGERAGRDWAVLPLDGPGYLVVAVGDRVTDVTAMLDELVR